MFFMLFFEFDKVGAAFMQAQSAHMVSLSLAARWQQERCKTEKSSQSGLWLVSWPWLSHRGAEKKTVLLTLEQTTRPHCTRVLV